MTSKQLRNAAGFQCDDFAVVYKTEDGTEIPVVSVQIDFEGSKVILRKE